MTDNAVCPNCNSRRVISYLDYIDNRAYQCECFDCHYVWCPEPDPHRIIEAVMVNRFADYVERLLDEARGG